MRRLLDYFRKKDENFTEKEKFAKEWGEYFKEFKESELDVI